MGCFAKMKAAMTVGGTFTFLCALVFFFNFLMFIPMKYGMKWREDRLLKQQRQSWLNTLAVKAKKGTKRDQNDNHN